MIRYLKKKLYALYLALNRGMGVTERWYAGEESGTTLPHRPIFILGAPRCGSTLLYQTMATVFEVGYLSNAHCILHGAPWLVERLLDPTDDYRSTSYRSRYGSVRGMSAPSECGNFWYRFFPRDPQYAPPDRCDPEKLNGLRTALRALGKAAGKPVLIKNLVNVLRLEAIMQSLPESLFIVLHRDEVDTAHSILESRKQRLGSYEAWFSLKPPQIESLRGAPVVRQVAEQIRTTYRLIGEAEPQGGGPFHHLAYEDFCSDPARELERIRGFFTGQGLTVPMNGPVPAPFETRSEIRIDRKLYNELLDYFEKQKDQTDERTH